MSHCSFKEKIKRKQKKRASTVKLDIRTEQRPSILQRDSLALLEGVSRGVQSRDYWIERISG